MRLFLSSLVLAVVVLFSAMMFFDAGTGYLRQHLLQVLGASIGSAALLGLFLAMLEVRHNNLRQRKRQSFLEEPAHSFRVMLSPSTAVAAGGDNLMRESEFTDTAVPQPIPSAVLVPESAPAPTNGIQAVEPVVEEEPEPEPEPVVERGPADQTLYLAHDFEFSEIQRVFRIWQMIPVEEHETANILGRWRIKDDTIVEVVDTNDGSPCIEIRGPMADELAEFLPQDLPVYPVQPNNAELM